MGADTDHPVRASQSTGTDGTERRSTGSGGRDEPTGRPVIGALALGVGSGLLAVQTALAFAGVVGQSTIGVLAMVSALGGVAGAVGAVVDPGRSATVGLAGCGLAIAAATGVLFAPAGPPAPGVVFAALVAAGVGGLGCLGTPTGGRTARLRWSGPPLQALAGVVVLGTVVVFALTGAPAAAGDTFPQQEDPYGGFVVSQDTLAAGEYSFIANCPQPETPFLNAGEGCQDITVDSTNNGSIQRTARQQLDDGGYSTGEVTINEFMIYKNFYRESIGYEHLEMTATEAVADSRDHPEEYRAIDVYISEYRSEALNARLDLIDTPFEEGLEADNIQDWTCTPHNESGSGTINDIRLGLDVDPRLTNGQDVTLLSHQLGSTKTVLYDFELRVEDGRHDPIQADAPPSTAPSNCK